MSTYIPLAARCTPDVATACPHIHTHVSAVWWWQPQLRSSLTSASTSIPVVGAATSEATRGRSAGAVQRSRDAATRATFQWPHAAYTVLEGSHSIVGLLHAMAWVRRRGGKIIMLSNDRRLQ